jgi:hypothetical protein
MRKARRGWAMPEVDARSMLRLIEERVRSAEIELRYWEVLIRLRGYIEDDLAGLDEKRVFSAGSAETNIERAIGCQSGVILA